MTFRSLARTIPTLVAIPHTHKIGLINGSEVAQQKTTVAEALRKAVENTEGANTYDVGPTPVASVTPEMFAL